MKFDWEKIYWSGFETYRAQVVGGWLIRNSDSSFGDAISESTVFVPDANHEWEIE